MRFARAALQTDALWKHKRVGSWIRPTQSDTSNRLVLLMVAAAIVITAMTAVACAGLTRPQEIEVTREVPVIQEVSVTVEITREIPVVQEVPVKEVTREIPVTQLVEVTREIPVTRLVETTRDVYVFVEVTREVPVTQPIPQIITPTINAEESTATPEPSDTEPAPTVVASIVKPSNLQCVASATSNPRFTQAEVTFDNVVGLTYQGQELSGWQYEWVFGTDAHAGSLDVESEQESFTGTSIIYDETDIDVKFRVRGDYGEYVGEYVEIICQSAPPNPERLALIDLYHATNGDGWKNNANWLSEAPISQWHGIDVDNEGKVVFLHLESNRLEGQLPASIDAFEQLRKGTYIAVYTEGATSPLF